MWGSLCLYWYFGAAGARHLFIFGSRLMTGSNLGGCSDTSALDPVSTIGSAAHSLSLHNLLRRGANPGYGRLRAIQFGLLLLEILLDVARNADHADLR